MADAAPAVAPAVVAPNISSSKSMIDYNLDGSKKDGSSEQPGRGADGKFVSGKQKAAPGQPGQVATPPETSAEKKFRLKVEGQDMEMSEQEVISEAQRSKFFQSQASKIAKELDMSRKERQNLTEELKAAMTDDDAMAELMRSLGRDPDKYAETRLAAKIKADMEEEEERRLPPDQRELRQL